MSGWNGLHSWPEIFRGANGPISTQALTKIFGRHFPSFVPGSENYGGTGKVRHNLGLPSRAKQFNPPRPVIPATFSCLHKAHFGTFSGDVSQKGYNS
jgi:hypothetical protein